MELWQTVLVTAVGVIVTATTGRYGTSDIGYLSITSTNITLHNMVQNIARITCTKDSATTIPVRIILQFPV